jgi:hypothetical protein
LEILPISWEICDSSSYNVSLTFYYLSKKDYDIK